MPALTKYNSFAEDLSEGLIVAWGTAHTFKAVLTNTTPNVGTHSVLADVGELSTGGGYTAGGIDIQNEGTRTGGTVYVTAQDITWTPSGGGFGPFRYIVLYDDTAAGDPLIGYFDYGSSLSPTTIPFTVDFGAYLFTVA